MLYWDTCCDLERGYADEIGFCWQDGDRKWEVVGDWGDRVENWVCL